MNLRSDLETEAHFYAVCSAGGCFNKYILHDTCHVIYVGMLPPSQG